MLDLKSTVHFDICVRYSYSRLRAPLRAPYQRRAPPEKKIIQSVRGEVRHVVHDRVSGLSQVEEHPAAQDALEGGAAERLEDVDYDGRGCVSVCADVED